MIRCLVAIAWLIVPVTASAVNLYLEPYLGYHTDAEFDFSAANSPTASGLTYGGRVGIDYMDFLVGLDYMTGSWKDNASPSDTITPGNLGLFFGYNFPEFLKIYATYFFTEKYSFSSSKKSTDYGGTEFRFGVGLTTLPVITINIEYGTGTLTTADGNTMNSNASVSYFGLVIGLPFEFEL